MIKNQTSFLCDAYLYAFYSQNVALHYEVKKRNFFPTWVTSVFSSMMTDLNIILLLTFFSGNFV